MSKEVLKYDPEWVVVPPRLIGGSLGTTDQEIPFEPYGSDPQYGKPLADTIPAGTPYYEIAGYGSQAYIAIPYKGNYFLYARPPYKKLAFPRGKGDAALAARFAGTPEQAYLEAFKDISDYRLRAKAQGDFLVLDVTGISLDDPHGLIALIEQYCEKRGSTLVIGSFETIKDKGYFKFDKDSQLFWHFKNGSIVSLGECVINGDHATVEASVAAAALAGQGRSFSLEKKGEAWVLMDSTMLWIS